MSDIILLTMKNKPTEYSLKKFLCNCETFSITNITPLMNHIKFLYKFQSLKPNYNNQE